MAHVATGNTLVYVTQFAKAQHNSAFSKILFCVKIVWEHYSQSSTEAGFCAAAYTTFLSYWRQLAPHILVMKLMTDLCWLCQKNSAAIMKSKRLGKTNMIIMRTCTHSLNRLFKLHKITLVWCQVNKPTTKLPAKILPWP